MLLYCQDYCTTETKCGLLNTRCCIQTAQIEIGVSVHLFTGVYMAYIISPLKHFIFLQQHSSKMKGSCHCVHCQLFAFRKHLNVKLRIPFFCGADPTGTESPLLSVCSCNCQESVRGILKGWNDRVPMQVLRKIQDIVQEPHTSLRMIICSGAVYPPALADQEK